MTAGVSLLGARLSDRAHRFGITLAPTELAPLEGYLLLLERWNRTINLTALPLAGFPDATLDRLVVEPLVAAMHVDRVSAAWVDLGSGGGSPAIPLKIVRPALELTMVEARSRKGAFLREAARTLGLTDVAVLTERFQQLANSRGALSADFVSVRAVRIDRRLLAASAMLLRPGGQLFLFGADSPSPSGATEGFRVVSEIPLPTPRAILRILQKTAI